MAALGNYGETLALDALFGDNHASNWPDTIYFALFTSGPGETGTSGEVSGGDYARVGVANDNTTWNDASGGFKDTAADIEFPTATASWGTVAFYAIFGTSTGTDEYLAYGPLDASVAVGIGDKVVFSAGDIIIEAR